MPTFRAGDAVKHGPTGETWVLAADQHGDDVVCAGWPESIAKAADCTLVEAATDDQRREMLMRVAESCTDQIRGSWARADLAKGKP